MMIDKEIIAVFHYDDKGSKCCGSEPYRYAEEIIRCKECVEYDDDWCMYWQNVINVYDFCSYGEREGE